MFGGVSEFLLKTFLGLPDGEYDKTVVLQPKFPHKLRRAKGSALYDGKIVEVEWRRIKNTIRYKVFVTEGLNVSVVYGNDITQLQTGENEICVEL